jgi:3',5'-cyclic AMP phosphodiesterase CpdA
MERVLLVILPLALALVGCPAPAPHPIAPAGSATHAEGAPVRYLVGGDSRGDAAHVLPWAFREARARAVTAVLFLGDMETTADLDDHFKAELPALGPIPFYPVLGNHETTRRAPAEDLPKEERTRALGVFRGRFLGPPRTDVAPAFDDKLTYALDLPGGVHFVALDNVSQSGFGADQLTWLGADLRRARADGRTKHILVGMHKALAGSGITRHAMDEDGPRAVADSEAALALFEEAHVEIIFASHFHGFAEYASHGIRSFITGGLGAPLDMKHGADTAFHHFLVVEAHGDAPLAVQVVRFDGAPAVAREHEQ